MKNLVKQYSFKERILVICYILAQLSLACLILFLKVGYTFVITTMIFVSLNFIVSTIFGYKYKLLLFISLGLLFTIVSDVFIIILQDYLLGLIFFNIAQLSYMMYLILHNTNAAYRISNVVVRIGLIILGEILTAILLNDIYDALIGLAVVYAINLICNCIFSSTYFKKSLLLFFGFLLFIFCDIFVGFNFLSTLDAFNKNEMVQTLSYTAINLPWVFYIPSQLLITSYVITFIPRRNILLESQTK